MKKILSALLATLMIATAAGCTSEEKTNETTQTEGNNAAETTEAAEPEVKTTSILTEDMVSFIEQIKDKAPIYADYFEENGMVPVRMGMKYSADLYGTGTESEVVMEVYMASLEKIALKTVTDGVSSDVIVADGTYYIISDAEKQAIYMILPEEEAASLTDSMTASMTAAFDPATATFETGTEEYNGTEYLFERINTAEAGEIVVYADTATKEVKYLVTGGIAMEITFLDHNVDEAVFTVPSDYELVDMESMMRSDGTEAE